MRRLWLHIGSHKTGTTSVQAALHQAQMDGKLDGLRYLNSDQKRNNISLVSSTGRGGKFKPEIRWAALDRCLSTQADGDAILSSEGLFWLSQPEAIDALAARLRPAFDQIRVIAYLRRQDQLALSHRKQVAFGLHATRFYGAEPTALPAYQPHFQTFFDYAAKLALWENAFGREAMHVRRYDRALLKDGDAVSDFFDLIGQTRFVPKKNVNPPLSRSQLLLALRLQQAGGYDRTVIRPLIKDLPDDGPLLPARSEAEAFLNHFTKSNQALAQAYDPDGPEGYFDPQMSKYPEAGNDDIAALGLDVEDILHRAARRSQRSA